ncbi:MAG: hypothetical protein WBG81_00025 [Rhodanobacter sp.]|uniref:hypothetical protein n=1 Tax=Rhodanobacter sp. KK11 TaxID=3083255 RepID=UPI002966550C|nr:hypothetical protein [Rhodanobacter sp. KK11]MDW2982750.1 hypothetical protein [Rhodanobacter sp. KK11]
MAQGKRQSTTSGQTARPATAVATGIMRASRGSADPDRGKEIRLTSGKFTVSTGKNGKTCFSPNAVIASMMAQAPNAKPVRE